MNMYNFVCLNNLMAVSLNSLREYVRCNTLDHDYLLHMSEKLEVEPG